MFTARPASTTTVVNEMTDCSIIASFAQRRERRHVGRRERRARVEGEEEVVDEAGAPPFLLGERDVARGRRDRHLREEERAARVRVAPLALVRAAAVEPPVPAREDDHVDRPQHRRGGEQLGAALGRSHETDDERHDTVQQAERERAEHAVRRPRVLAVHAEAAKDRRRDHERADDEDEKPRSAGPQRGREREVERDRGAGRDDDGPARLGALDVRGVAQHARAYRAARLVARGSDALSDARRDPRTPGGAAR